MPLDVSGTVTIIIIKYEHFVLANQRLLQCILSYHQGSMMPVSTLLPRCSPDAALHMCMYSILTCATKATCK